LLKRIWENIGVHINDQGSVSNRRWHYSITKSHSSCFKCSFIKMYKNLSSVILLFYWTNSYTLFILVLLVVYFNLVKMFLIYRVELSTKIHNNQGPCQKTSCMIGVIRTFTHSSGGSNASANDSMLSDSGELEGIEASILACCWDSS